MDKVQTRAMIRAVKCKYSMLDQNSQKNEMEAGAEIASLPSERWKEKAAEWNPELSSRYKTCTAIGRPKRRWEDEINEFLKLEETEMSTENDKKYNNSWTEEDGHC